MHINAPRLIHRDTSDRHTRGGGGLDDPREVALAKGGGASRHGDTPLNDHPWRKLGRIDKRIAQAQSTPQRKPREVSTIKSARGTRSGDGAAPPSLCHDFREPVVRRRRKRGQSRNQLIDNTHPRPPTTSGTPSARWAHREWSRLSHRGDPTCRAAPIRSPPNFRCHRADVDTASSARRRRISACFGIEAPGCSLRRSRWAAPITVS